jgi:prepilin-type N-terminal cleavage/methylation domain-containing protein
MKAMRHTAGEAGFTLTELIIVLGLMGFVLGAIYAASSALIQSANVSEAQSTFARDSGEPMRLIARNLMQAIQLENTAPQSITFRTDRKMDGTGQRVIVTATGSFISYKEWDINSQFVNNTVNPRLDLQYSTSSVNVATNVPLFEYYDSQGARISNMELAPSAARSIVMTLALRAAGTDFSTSQRVYLRNRATE